MQSLTILGATGSIGGSTLEVIRRHPERFRVYAVTAFQRWQALLPICLEFKPDYAVVGTEEDATQLRLKLKEQHCLTQVLSGPDSLVAVASAAEVDIVMAAIVGAAGLPPTLAAARAGKRILLANKEALVMAGPLFMTAVREGKACLLPIDSEHNAIFQCLPSEGATAANGVRRLLLTASGGPFRGWDTAALRTVTPEQACAHPNWVMGRKISVDSATLMNKGLEVIEAHWLFGMEPARIEVVVHPQSVIHSMVEYADGSVLAQLGQPDMRTPIANGLAWPQRIDSGVTSLDFTRLAALTFEPADQVTFPCLRLAYAALAAGGSAPAILNAANEVAVAAFLSGHSTFTGIAKTVAAVLNRLPTVALESVAHLLEIDRESRELATQLLS
ncbi:1-deoxy-D-xylulose-5-phosphate reductoisomerase [Parvibium lacunae]|uniref:1-deoxy-D-xylulose 5-phosphate reductoisomerase n=1 Tax=Parvibium lacunae TaxID=1888893 RepID=A0A368L8J2_9BURK|nr:1-deoxy-D-xylulose-5-phosphate reductoisomerase [Parvibium lacunae]RCS59924.1 1-deoxy-D-xylulose-5-phosphate reductoisomerase [Parvibium lacunae]